MGMIKAGRKHREYSDDTELLDNAEALLDALDRNEPEEILHQLAIKMPLHPAMALSWKRRYGKKFVLESGYDLTEVNAALGEGWLDA